MVDWKRSIIKTIIYRIITLILGTITAYVGTGDIAAAGGVALLTEAVQSVNYFIYETIWSHFEEKRLRRKIEKELIDREIEMKIDYSFLRDLSYELSQFDTFIPEVYSAIIKFYNRLLNNEELENLHEEIRKHKQHFITAHTGRGLIYKGDILDEAELEEEKEETEKEEVIEDEEKEKDQIKSKNKKKEL